MRNFFVLLTLAGCSSSPPSPSARDRPLGGDRFPPGMGPKGKANSG